MPPSGADTVRLSYDGVDLIAEYDTSGALLRRYVRGPGSDELLVWYEGSGTTDRRWLVTDERGSVVAVTNASGSATAINSYDEYGIPASGNTGTFQYTGQAWLAPLGLSYYKNRMYSPTLGRFMQTDPIGYGDGPNWYNYVGSDPVNFTDPLGLGPKPEPQTPCQKDGNCEDKQPDIVVVGPKQDKGKSDEIVVHGYWRKQLAASNPVAPLGLQFGWDRPSQWLVSRGKEILIGAILGTPVNGRYPTLKQGLATYEKIRVALTAADQAARAADKNGVPGLLSPGQVYDYHIAVFARFGLPSTAFGGSFLTGTRAEAFATSAVWCGGCDW